MGEQICWGACGEGEMTAGTARPSTLRRFMIPVLGISLLVVIAAIVFIIVAPAEGEHYTEFYLLGEDGVAAGYPGRVHVGEPETVIIGVHNYEYRNVAYQVEVYLLNQTTNQNESIIYVMKPLDQFSIPLSHDQSEEFVYTFIINEMGYNRLEFLLFNETLPPDQMMGRDRINASYRDLYLRIRME